MQLSFRTAALSAAVVAFAAVAPSLAQVTVTPSNNAQLLAETFTGPGITIVPGSAQLLNGDPTQQGTFASTSASTIGFTNGVVLTSGDVANIPGPNVLGSTSTITGSGSDPQLAALATATVNDANVLQFQFTVPANIGGLNFQYVFSSEEYNSFVGSSFNDVFGLFVDGTNVALVPGTSTPVSINSVNGGYSTTPASNSQFYVTNHASTFDAPTNGQLADPARLAAFEPDGLTTVLNANALPALNPNLTVHTIKIAVGDVSDSSYDSQVFLRADSFVVPEPGVAALGLVAAGGLLARRARRATTSRA